MDTLSCRALRYYAARARESAMVSAEPSRFGQMLRRFRTAAGLTQEELAERAGLSTRGVQDLERGLRRSPHPGTTHRLAEALALGPAERAELLATTDPAATSARESVKAARAAAHLRVPPTDFIGRARELTDVA